MLSTASPPGLTGPVGKEGSFWRAEPPSDCNLDNQQETRGPSQNPIHPAVDLNCRLLTTCGINSMTPSGPDSIWAS